MKFSINSQFFSLIAVSIYFLISIDQMQQYLFIEMNHSIIYIFLFLFVLSYSQNQVYPRLGGVSDVSAEELQKFLGQEMTQTAISKIKQEFQKKYNTNLQIKKYLYGKTQVVAGQIITLGFQTSNGDQYEAAVWLKVWMNFAQVQYLKQIDPLASQPSDQDLQNVETQPQKVGVAEPIAENQVVHLDGGVDDVPADELQNFLDRQLTKMAIQKIKEEFQKQYNKGLSIKKYLYGKSQVVAGQIITLGFQTVNGGKYEAAVLLQTWMNVVQLKYLKEISPEVNTGFTAGGVTDVAAEVNTGFTAGGVTDVAADKLNNFLASEMTKMAIKKIQQEFEKKYNTKLSIKKYLYGKSQVVAGQIITLGFETSRGDQFEAAVLIQTWMNIVQLKYLKQINQISNMQSKPNLQNVQAPAPTRVTAMPLGASNYPKVSYLSNAETQAPSIIPEALPFRGQKIQIISNPGTSMTVNVELPKFFDQSVQPNHKNCQSLSCNHLKVGKRIRN